MEGDRLSLLDQRKIPFSKEFIECKTLEDVIDSIKAMVVRGAPAIANDWYIRISLRIKKQKEKIVYENFYVGQELSLNQDQQPLT